MTSSTFFIIFIPILAIILLAVNSLLSLNSPLPLKSSGIRISQNLKNKIKIKLTHFSCFLTGSVLIYTPYWYDWNPMYFYILVIFSMGAFLFAFLISHGFGKVYKVMGEALGVFSGYLDHILGETVVYSNFNDTFIVLNMAIIIAMITNSILVSYLLRYLDIKSKSIVLDIWENKYTYLQLVWRNKKDVMLIILAIILVTYIINTLLFMAGLGIIIKLTTPQLFFYTFLSKITSIRVSLLIIICSITKELRIEQVSLSIPTVLAIIVMGAFNFYILIPYIKICTFSILNLEVLYTKVCLFFSGMKLSACKYFTDNFYTLYNLWISIFDKIKAYYFLHYQMSSNRESIFRFNNSNLISYSKKVIPLSKLSRFTSIHIAKIVPNNLDLTIQFKGNAKDFSVFFSSYVNDISNFVRNCASLTCRIHLICSKEITTVDYEFINGYLKNSSIDKFLVGNNDNFNYSPYNKKHKNINLLGLTKLDVNGSNLNAFMEIDKNTTKFSIEPSHLSKVTSIPHFYELDHLIPTPKLSNFMNMSFGAHIQLNTVFVRFNYVYYVAFLDLTDYTGYKLRLLYKDRLFTDLWPIIVNYNGLSCYALAPYPFYNFNTEAAEWVINQSHGSIFDGFAFSPWFRYFFIAPVQTTWYRLIDRFFLTVATGISEVDFVYLTPNDDTVLNDNLIPVKTASIFTWPPCTLIRLLTPPTEDNSSAPVGVIRFPR